MVARSETSQLKLVGNFEGEEMLYVAVPSVLIAVLTDWPCHLESGEL